MRSIAARARSRCADGRQVGQFHAVFGQDDETELVAVLAAPVEESTAILHVALARIDLALLAILRHAVPFKIT